MSYSVLKKIPRAIASLSLIAFLASASQAALADDAAAVKTIAGVLVGLNHFPSAEDKAALAAIATSSTSVGLICGLRSSKPRIHRTIMSSARVPAYKLPAFPNGERTASTRRTLVEVVAVVMPLGYPRVTTSKTRAVT